MSDEGVARATDGGGLGLSVACGDVVAARALAENLLAPLSSPRRRRDARLLLMAICLHLDSANGPEPQMEDVVRVLKATARSLSALNSLAESPIEFLRYAWAELQGLESEELHLAISLCLETADQTSP